MQQKLVPPDGGWGWMVVFATALSHICVIPLMLNLGLVFKQIFDDLGFSHEQSSVIINTNAAFGMSLGVINGALLKYFGYRKVAFFAGFLVTSGVALTAYATTFLQYFFFYGCLTSLGMGMILASYIVALNSFFSEKRGQAVSLAMTITGLGPVVTPQLINLLLQTMSSKETILIVAGVCGHTMVAACLLQPIKWHLKAVDGEAEALKPEIPENPEKNPGLCLYRFRWIFFVGSVQKRPSISRCVRSNSIVDSAFSINHERDAGAIYGFDTALAGSVLSLNPVSVTTAEGRKLSVCNTNANFDVELLAPENKEKTRFRRILWNVVNFLDLTLLCDLTYLNIMVGMSLAVFAEISFSTLTPFILAEKGLTLTQNATCLSALATADIIFRFFAPYVGKLVSKEPRVLYMFSLSLLIASRFILIFFRSFRAVLWVCAFLGVARGLRTVYMNLVIPSYVPIQRLASASGLQMMVNGIFVIAGAPVLGFIRDVTGSYDACICVTNAVTFSCIVTWTTEMLWSRWRNVRL